MLSFVVKRNFDMDRSRLPSFLLGSRDKNYPKLQSMCSEDEAEAQSSSVSSYRHPITPTQEHRYLDIIYTQPPQEALVLNQVPTSLPDACSAAVNQTICEQEFAFLTYPQSDSVDSGLKFELSNLLHETLQLQSKAHLPSEYHHVQAQLSEETTRKRSFSDFEHELQIDTSSNDSSDFEEWRREVTPGPSKRVCLPLTNSSEITDSPSISVSPAETGEYDSQDDGYSFSTRSSVSDGEFLAAALSPDLENIDITPIIKSDLKDAIKIRRKKKGLPDLVVKEEPPKPDKLTEEEEEKRRQRRERNRLAAAKCRRKKREAAEFKRKKAEEIEKQNLGLLDEMEELLKTRAHLKEILKDHLKECKIPELRQISFSFLARLEQESEDALATGYLGNEVLHHEQSHHHEYSTQVQYGDVIVTELAEAV